MDPVVPHAVGVGPPTPDGTGRRRPDPRARRLAQIILSKTLRVARGESVTIDTWSGTLPWANAFVFECHRMGALPTLLFRDEPTFWDAASAGNPRSLGSDHSGELAMLERTDAYVDFWGPSDIAREAALPSAFHERRSKSLEKWWAVANRIGLRLAVLYLGRIGAKAASSYGVAAGSWSRELVEASLVDPVGMDRAGRRLAARLKIGSEVTIDHPNGTHLKLRLKGRSPFVFGGLLETPERPPRGTLGVRRKVVETPIPAGYVNVAVDEEFAEGRFVSNVPAELSVAGPDRLDGGVWEFSEGRLVHQSYRREPKWFHESYERGGSGHDRVALLDIGLNPKIRRAPWMRDQRLGTVTVAIGGNRYFGGTNGTEFRANLHLTGATVRIDGTTVVQGNRLR